jgi:hypothetical protein
LQPSCVSGEVRDEAGPVAGARVRFQGTARSVNTNRAGGFALPRLALGPVRVTAWKEGYLIGSAAVGAKPVHIRLRRLPVEDHEEYAWVQPTPDSRSSQNCGNCHGEIYREWAASSHARSATNRHFLSLYDGSDWAGRPGMGWNLLGDHPDGAGVCTACHAPSVSFGDPAYFDLRRAQGVPAHGVHCDYCHKVAGTAGGAVGLTHGRFGLSLLRPARGQLFFGPLDDVDRGEDAASELYRDSRYCASCHEGTVFGVPVYSTYSEWQASPARRAGKQCQTCHMTPTGALSNFAPGKGGIERDPSTLASHRLLGGSREEMLRRCLRVSLKAAPDRLELRTEVMALEDRVGHQVPTGFGDRNIVFVVEARDRAGRTLVPCPPAAVLPPSAGPTLVGVPGRLYAKQLSDFDGNTPVPFWKARPEVVDTRLKPGQIERVAWRFTVPVERVRVRLLYRRFWPTVAEAKKWPDRDLVLVDRIIPLAGEGTAWSGP